MARRVAVDPESRTATTKPHSAEREGVLLRLLDVVHGDIEMHLLRRISAWPAGRVQIGRQLEGQAGPLRHR